MRLVGPWGVAHDEVKGGLGGGRIRPGIVYILSEWKPSVPSGLAVVDEDAEILLKPLIRSFGLAVSLGVVGGAYVLRDVEDTAKFLREMGRKTGISVRDDLAGSAVVWENMLDVKIGNSGGGSRFVAGNEDGRFRAIVVGNGEDAVKAVREGELNNEIHGDSFEGEGGAVSCDGAVGNTGARGNGFGGLTGGATSDERGDKGFHMGPPIIFGDEKASFEDAGVTCGGGVMV
jgi:hypothetical protein